ncbi:hypothetical protein Taro_032388, partial [Colocasia esculenta]|nr:hypothetical protein [Colocasia esculenta]
MLTRYLRSGEPKAMDGKVAWVGAESADSESGRPLATRLWGGTPTHPQDWGSCHFLAIPRSGLASHKLSPGERTPLQGSDVGTAPPSR